MAEIFDKQFDNNNTQGDSWYLKAAYNAAILGGFAFGLPKMKGPVRKLVKSIYDTQTLQEAQRQAEKINRDAFDAARQNIDLDYIIKNKYVSDPFNVSSDVDFEFLRVNETTIKDIKRIETTVLEEGDKILARQYPGWKEKVSPVFDIATKIEGEAANAANRGEYFAQARHEALLDFLSREPILRGESAPVGSYEDLLSVTADTKKINSIHEYYLENSPDYARMYRTKIRRVLNALGNKYVQKKIKTKGSYKDIIQHGKYDTSFLGEAEIYGAGLADEATRVRKVYGGVVPDRQGQKYFDLIAEFKEGLLEERNRWTSRSHNFRETGQRLYDQIGKFDYTGYFKDLANTLDKLTNDASSPIEDASLLLETRGEYQHARIKLKIANYDGNAEFSIPISRDSKMPGKSRGASPRFDALFTKGDDAALTPERGIGINRTQQTIRKIRTLFESSFTHKLGSNPAAAINSIQRTITHQLQGLPLAAGTGEMRDAGKMLAVHNETLMNITNSGKGKSIMLKNYMRDSIQTARNINKIVEAKRTGRKAVAIGFDLETIGYRDLGPTAQARDLRTQVHTANISTVDFTAKGNIVTDTDTMVSDHVIDYLNKNDGWNSSKHKEGNIPWIRQLLDMPNASESEVKDAFVNYMRRRAKGNYARSKDNREFMNKLADNLLNRIRDATRNGDTDVFLVTKNGTPFDMRILDIWVPEKAAEIRKLAPHIDTQSIAYMLKEGHFGDESLALKSLLQKMLGDMRLDATIDIEAEGGFEKFTKEIRKRKIRGNTIIDFSKEMNSKMQDLFRLKAHESPAVDNIGNFALLAKYISSSESGDNHFSTEYLNDLGKLLAMGNKPLNLQESQYLFNLLQRQLPKYGELGTSFATSNMLAKGILSMLDYSMMVTFPNVQRNKDVHQLFRGKYNFAISSKYRNKMSKGIDKTGRFLLEAPLVTQGYKDAEFALMGAQDRAHQFSKHVILDTFFTWGGWSGREGMDNISTEAAQMIEASNIVSVALDDMTFDSMPALSEELRSFNREVRREAVRIAKVRTKHDVAAPSFEDYELAGRRVSAAKRYKELEIPVISAHGMAEGDFGVKTAKGEMAGRIVGISVEENIRNPSSAPAIRAKVEYLSTLDGIGNITARGYGSKASASISAHTFGAQSHAAADFVTKGYAGAAKQLLLMKSIDTLRRQALDPGDDGKRAQAQLTKLASQLKAEWTGSQMITPDNVNNIDFKYAKNAKERSMLRKWLGSTPIGFNEILNTLSKSGHAWENETELATGFYQQWIGWKGTAHRTVQEGQSYMKKLATQHAEKAIKDLNDATSETGQIFRHLDQELHGKISSEITQFYNTLFVPEVHGAKVGEWRDADGLIPTSPGQKGLFEFGISAPDMKALYDINSGKGLRPTALKIRHGIMEILKRGEAMVSDTTLQDVSRNLKVNFSNKHKVAKRQLNRFLDALIAKSSTEVHLTVKDIQELLKRRADADLGNALRELQGRSQDTIRQYLNSLEEFVDMPEEEKALQIDEIIDTLNETKVYDALKDPESPWMSSKEIHTWSKMAKKYANYDQGGVFRVDTGLKDGLVLDFQKLMRTSDERFPMFQEEADELVNMFRNMMDATNKKTGEGSGIVKKIIDKTTETGERIQQVVLDKRIILPAFDRPDVLANRVTNSLFRASDHLKFSREILSHVNALDTAIKSGGDVESEASILAKKYVDLFRRTLPITHRGIFGGDFLYEPIGKMGPVRGAEVVQVNAMRMKLDQVKRSKSMENMIDQVLKADASTAFISRSQLESMPIRLTKADQIRLNVDANVIKYSTYLDKELGSDMAMKILSGEMAAPGYHLRYPLEQQGTRSLLDMKFLALDDALGKELGMDGNAIYTNLLTMLQNEDYDSDRGGIALKLLSVTNKNLKGEDAYRHIMGEHDTILTKLLNSPDVKTINTTRSMGYAGNGQVRIAHWGKSGKLETKLVDYNSKEAQEAQEHILGDIGKLARNIVIDQADVITPNFVKSRFNIGFFNALMKNQIGVVTNALGRQMHHVMQAGTIKDPLVKKFLIGHLSMGLPGVGQEFMKFGKHGSEAAIAQFSKVAEQLNNPNTQSKELQEFLENTFREQMESQADESKMFWGKNPETFSKEVTAAFLQEEEARRVAIGGDRRLKTQLRALDRFAIGHRETGFTDLVTAKTMDVNSAIDYAVFRNLSETGFHTDLSDIMPQKSLVSELGERVAKRFNIADMGSSFKKAGKWGSIAAAGFLALNFFRPNQMSNSMNPLDGFVDLGADIDGNHNRIATNVQLSRRLPINMVNASFSKEAFVRMQDKDHEADRAKQASVTVKDLLGMEYSDMYEFRKFKEPPVSSYTNYTSNIGYFGSSNLKRRSSL